MTKEKLTKLKVYLEKLNDQLSGAVPVKHKCHPESYKEFLLNEIRIVKKSIEYAELNIK